MVFVYVLVVDSVFLLSFVGKSSHFEMIEIVAVFVCNILECMVQKYLVESNHHQMISNLYNKVFVAYSYFVEKMGNFHYNLMEGVDNLGSLLSWLMYWGDFNSENIRGSAFFFEEVDLIMRDLRNYSCVLQNCFL